MNDIGVVEYSKDMDNNCIRAYWFYQKGGKWSMGTGIAVGDLGDTYEGDYIVTYYDRKGIELSKYNLRITRSREFYELLWTVEGCIKFIGAGMEKDNKLFVGWKSNQETYS
jgi:hypothetical protein